MVAVQSLFGFPHEGVAQGIFWDPVSGMFRGTTTAAAATAGAVLEPTVGEAANAA